MTCVIWLMLWPMYQISLRLYLSSRNRWRILFFSVVFNSQVFVAEQVEECAEIIAFRAFATNAIPRHVDVRKVAHHVSEAGTNAEATNEPPSTWL